MTFYLHLFDCSKLTALIFILCMILNFFQLSIVLILFSILLTLADLYDLNLAAQLSVSTLVSCFHTTTPVIDCSIQ